MNQQVDRPQFSGATASTRDRAANLVILQDGTHALVRSIVPSDSAALQWFHSRLSR